jgi:guanylate kinase
MNGSKPDLLSVISSQAGGTFCDKPTLEQLEEQGIARNNYLVLLVGCSGSGKDSILQSILLRQQRTRGTNFTPVQKLISRPKRGEEPYVEKKPVTFFRSREGKPETDLFMLWCLSGSDCEEGAKQYYAIRNEDIAGALMTTDAIFAVTQPATFTAFMSKKLPVKTIPILITPSDETRLEERLRLRKGYTDYELQRRTAILEPAWRYFRQNEDKFSAVVVNDNPDGLTDKLVGATSEERDRISVAINHAIETSVDRCLQIMSVYDSAELREHDSLEVAKFDKYFADEISRRFFGFSYEAMMERTGGKYGQEVPLMQKEFSLSSTDPTRSYLALRSLKVTNVTELNSVLTFTFNDICQPMYNSHFMDDLVAEFLGRMITHEVIRDSDRSGITYRCTNPDQRQNKRLKYVDLYFPA